MLIYLSEHMHYGLRKICFDAVFKPFLDFGCREIIGSFSCLSFRQCFFAYTFMGFAGSTLKRKWIVRRPQYGKQWPKHLPPSSLLFTLFLHSGLWAGYQSSISTSSVQTRYLPIINFCEFRFCLVSFCFYSDTLLCLIPAFEYVAWFDNITCKHLVLLIFPK